jgi:hypothetical protein
MNNPITPQYIEQSVVDYSNKSKEELQALALYYVSRLEQTIVNIVEQIKESKESKNDA